MEDDILITWKEAGLMLGLKSHKSVRKLADKGSIIERTVNGRPKYVKSSVVNFIAKGHKQ